MAVRHRILAVLLALVLIGVPFSAVRADGGVTNPGVGNTNDGHPWDDQAQEGVTTPGDGGGTANGCTSQSKSVTSVGSGTICAGSAGFVQTVLMRAWQRFVARTVVCKASSSRLGSKPR
jgi:hypothetical protein